MGGLLFECKLTKFSSSFSGFSLAELSRIVPAFIRLVLTLV